ncbi:cation:proton antiporter [Brevundimonas aveniformis]|uniref:cation:proton antiporter domain-containing protein n=1 Tax=Brevundimonas aveniformis TaxID=370977 RepID=UPI00249272F0|nr:cation:proton antiporter [Brevundimonas aveniformis]
MTHGPAPTEYKDIFVFLAAAGVLVPLFNRLKVSPVLGFLAAGVLLGPDGLGRLAGTFEWVDILTISDRSQIAVLAELGVVFLMFTIGLELSWERLKSMRRLVFGMGMAQILVCAALLGVLFYLMGRGVGGALVLGFALALSSTAVVMPVMAERGRLSTTAGRSTFSVLLAQDLAVAPILIMVAVLGSGVGDDGLSPAAIGQAVASLLPSVVGVGLLVVLGRVGLRPMFRSVARAKNTEMFLATCLFVVLGTVFLAQFTGLSPAVGALVAGLLIAETEFRREVEVTIEPFKGLLLGVFFVSVGVGLDLDAVAVAPVTIFSIAALLILIKAVAIFGVARAFKVPPGAALETALVLGPAGEFAFVILNEAIGYGVVGRDFAQGVLLSATLSLFAVPILAALAPRIDRRIRPKIEISDTPNPDLEDGPQDTTAVIIVGYGRVGQLIGELLREHDIGYLAVDADPSLVSKARLDGMPVWYGDAGRPDLLEKLGLGHAKAVIVTMDAPGKVDEVCRAVRHLRSDVVLVARARDEKHAARLYKLGVTDAVPETTEASLQLAENALVDLGVPMGMVLASIHQKREDFRKIFQASMPEGNKRPTRALRGRLGTPQR